VSAQADCFVGKDHADADRPRNRFEQKEDTMEDHGALEGLLAFHGHRCWASTAGVRAGRAALRALGIEASGGKSLHAIVEIGDHHGAMCFADGIQHATQCTFGKGNIEKSHRGKLAVTLIDTASDRKVRVSYKPTLQPQIAASAFMRKRAAGIPANEIPEAEQLELVGLIWDASEEDVLAVGPVEAAGWRPVEEVIRFAVCPGCRELVAEPYLRVVGEQRLCLDCSGYQS
jgi:formylmethanofuran dehydrogenase subunit E